MSRFRRWHRQRVGVHAVADGVQMALVRYGAACREELRLERAPVLSVALDGTRMDTRDTLYVAVYAPGLQVAAWAPPQALASALRLLPPRAAEGLRFRPARPRDLRQTCRASSARLAPICARCARIGRAMFARLAPMCARVAPMCARLAP
eukprot:8595615-Lingulodinium_polyedra.AAC.1